VVGQATGMGFSNLNNSVLFHDIDANKIAGLQQNGYLATAVCSEAVCSSEVVFVCVPTPTVNGKIDLSIITNCAKNIGKALKKVGQYVLVVFRSTIPPQTTSQKLVPILERYSDLRAGKDFGVCMNPEFLREKTPLEDFMNPSRIIIGELDKKSGDMLSALYSQFKCPIIRTDLDTAEMIKYASNLFLASKISFFNEIYMIADGLGIDSKTVGEAVSLDPRIGRYGVFGGKPFGGMCLPKDLAAFIEFALERGINPKLLEAISHINQEVALYNSERKKKR
jgi:UDPglucose 6-dehydrogenase